MASDFYTIPSAIRATRLKGKNIQQIESLVVGSVIISLVVVACLVALYLSLSPLVFVAVENGVVLNFIDILRKLIRKSPTYTNTAAKVSPENTSFGYFLRLISILAGRRKKRTRSQSQSSAKISSFFFRIWLNVPTWQVHIMANVKSRQRFFFAVKFLRNWNVIGHDNGIFFSPFNQKKNRPF